jgi:hypothetical protein
MSKINKILYIPVTNNIIYLYLFCIEIIVEYKNSWLKFYIFVSRYRPIWGRWIVTVIIYNFMLDRIKMYRMMKRVFLLIFAFHNNLSNLLYFYAGGIILNLIIFLFNWLFTFFVS